MIEKPNSPSIFETNIFFMVIAFLLITIGARVQAGNIYTGLLITEYIIILLPTILFLKWKGVSLREYLRLNPISFKDFILIILIMVSSYPVMVFFNYIGLIFIHIFGQIQPLPIPIPTRSSEFLTSFLIIALTPGICEELMFKGLVLNSYESLGQKKAIVYSAILFGLFHFNMQNFLGPIYLGIILGIIFIKTDSLYSSILGHTTSNTIALTIGYFFSNGAKEISTSDPSLSGLNVGELLISLIGIGLIAIFFAMISYRLIRLLDKGSKDSRTKNLKLEKEYNYNLSIKPYLDYKYGSYNYRSYEMLPVLIVIIIFMLFNYLHFFL